MASLMRSPAAKLSAGVSRATWSAAARRKSACDLGGVEGLCLDGAAQAGVDGEVGGDSEGRRRGHAGFGEKVEQRGVVLVDLAQRVFHLGQGAG